MNKLFDAQSWRNRLTALGVILDLKPLPEDVTLRVPADEINQVSCGTTEGRGLRLADFRISETRAVAEGRTSVNANGCQPKAESSSGQSEYQASPAGTFFPLEQSVIRAEERAKLFRETTGTFLPDLVCQNPDCGKVSTCLFSCDFCEECNRRCSACHDEHMAAGHESDSSTAAQQHQGIHLLGGRNGE